MEANVCLCTPVPYTTACYFSRGPFFLRRRDANPRSRTSAGRDPRRHGHASASGLDRGERGLRVTCLFAGSRLRGHNHGDHVAAETDAAGNAVAGSAVESPPVAAACARVAA